MLNYKSDNDDSQEYQDFRAKPILNRAKWLSAVIAFFILSCLQLCSWLIVGISEYAEYKSNLANANASINWVTTSGTVKKSVVERRSKYWQSYRYEPIITYSYLVNNKVYEQNLFSFPNPHFDTRRQTEKFIEQYRKGDSVKVFYDPKNPKNSCLSNGITKNLKRTFFWRADESHNE